MNDQYRSYGAATQTMDTSVDAGLRAFMLSVYNNMIVGLVITGVVALGAANLFFESLSAPIMLTELGATVFNTPLKWVVMLSPLVMVFVLSFGVNKLSSGMARILFYAFAALMGVSLSSIFAVYTETSIATTFFVTAAAFGSLSLWGYTTKRNLTGMGNFLFMGVIGLVLAMIVNMFIGSGPLEMAISVLGVLIFAGLTAYDTQRLKMSYYAFGGDKETAGKMAINGALSLYLDFINMFLFLLRLFGSRD